MREIEDWRGHRVLAVPETSRTWVGLIRLRQDLGLGDWGRKAGCTLCPAWDTTKPEGEQRCANPFWYQPLMWGGCVGHFVIAEEYIPLVKMRLGDLL